MAPLVLDGKTFTPDLVRHIKRFDQKIELSEEAWVRVEKSRAVIDNIVSGGRTKYGINTGIGTKFSEVVISQDQLEELNVNLIRSHAAGVGSALSPERTRVLLAVRINSLANGYAGISRVNLEKCIAALNANCLPIVPERGTVGAHDLAQLSHLTLGLMGEGDMWSPTTQIAPAIDVLQRHGLTPMQLQPKDGISMINGSHFIMSLGAEAAARAKMVVDMADVIAATSVEGLVGTIDAFDPDIHNARPHKGQIAVARTIRSLLNNQYQKSEICESWAVSRVQDPYTLRCIPQVHGISHDIVDFATNIIQDELNSATDNPMVLADINDTINCGNFHGEYPAKALDYLAIGVHEIGNMAERRIERLCNPACSELPAFLTLQGGLNSGFMIAQVTASALVSENKTLVHPASVDSISTSAGYEDHVSMGGWAARKGLIVIENVENILAIELLCACQAIDLRRPLTSTPILEKLHAEVRHHVKFMNQDHILADDIKKIRMLIENSHLWDIVKDHIEQHTD